MLHYIYSISILVFKEISSLISSFLNILFSLFNTYKVYNDAPEPWAFGFQDGVSPGFSGIVDLHDNIFFYLVVIAILVAWMLGSIIYYFNSNKSQITHKYLVHGTLIEVLWTIFPAVVLLAIAIPSFRLLYILDEVTLPTITIKATGLFNFDGLLSEVLLYSLSFLTIKKEKNFVRMHSILFSYDRKS